MSPSCWTFVHSEWMKWDRMGWDGMELGCYYYKVVVHSHLSDDVLVVVGGGSGGDVFCHEAPWRVWRQADGCCGSKKKKYKNPKKEAKT
jgi:hypothetical protein